MATITALTFNAYGGPEVVNVSSIPKPTISKDTEILVKVKAAAVNPADFLFIAGNYNQKVDTFPSRLGFEGAGIVEEVGKEVKLNVGQRIHFVSLGSWAEYVVIDTAKAHPIQIPDQLSFEEAAQLTVNPLTAVGMLDELGPKAGEFLIQDAASSALARIVIQLAKAKGVKTINVVRRDEHIEPLKAIGADYVINSEKEDVVKRVFEIAPEGVKHALDAVAGKTGGLLTKVLAEGGTMLIYGALGGFTLEADVNALLFKSATVRGFYLYKWVGNRGNDKLKQDFGAIIKAILTKEIALAHQDFDGKTQAKEALKHAQTPGKAEKTLLIF